MNNPVRGFLQDTIEVKPFLEFRDRLAGKRVLEIGCGNGNGAWIINKYFYPNELIGIDLDPEMIKLARNRKMVRTKFEVGDASKLSFTQNTFDAVFDFDIIAHIPNWKEAIDEIYRVLKNGGIFFVEEMSIDTFESGLGKLFRPVLDHPYEEMYGREEFIAYLEEAGFKILRNEARNPLGLLKYFTVVATKNSR